MDVQVQVAGQITSKPTSNGGVKFDIPLSNGMKASTFDAVLATKVSQFGGQPFTARIEQKPNPKGGNPYTNITAAAGPGEQLPPEIPQAGTPIGTFPQQSQQSQAVTFPPAGVNTTPTPIVSAPSGGGGMSAEDKTRITKLAVLNTAYALVGSLFHGAGEEAMEQVVQFADALAKKLYTDARSHEPGAVPQQPQAAPVAEAPVVAADPAAVAAFVAAQAGAPVVQVGTEGLPPAQPDTASLPWSS